MTDPLDFSALLLQGLREETGCPALEYAQPPERIPAGHETDVYTLALRGGPPGSDQPLVARCFAEPCALRAASLEAAIHEALGAQGFAVPRVLAARDAAPAFLVMERLPGRGIGDGLEFSGRLRDRLRGLATILGLSLKLPEWLGEVTAQLLALDPEPVRSALAARGLPLEAIGFDRHIEEIERRVRDGELSGQEAGLRWLLASRPPPAKRPALCHGDLAPNVLVDDGRVTGVIDWSSAFVTLGDPEFEIGNSQAMIQIPLPLPVPLARAIGLYQRRMVERFLRALGPDCAPSPERVRYYAAWRWFRSLCGAAEIWNACAAGAPFPERPDPWCVPAIARKVADQFHVLTGVAIHLPDPPER